jgi:hypothetical protein
MADRAALPRKSTATARTFLEYLEAVYHAQRAANREGVVASPPRSP